LGLRSRGDFADSMPDQLDAKESKSIFEYFMGMTERQGVELDKLFDFKKSA